MQFIRRSWMRILRIRKIASARFVSINSRVGGCATQAAAGCGLQKKKKFRKSKSCFDFESELFFFFLKKKATDVGFKQQNRLFPSHLFLIFFSSFFELPYDLFGFIFFIDRYLRSLYIFCIWLYINFSPFLFYWLLANFFLSFFNYFQMFPTAAEFVFFPVSVFCSIFAPIIVLISFLISF